MGFFTEWRKQRLIEKEWDKIYRIKPKPVKKGRLDTNAPDPVVCHEFPSPLGIRPLRVNLVAHEDGTYERWNPENGSDR